MTGKEGFGAELRRVKKKEFHVWKTLGDREFERAREHACFRNGDRSLYLFCAMDPFDNLVETYERFVKIVFNS